jgi:hypothetical protein
MPNRVILRVLCVEGFNPAHSQADVQEPEVRKLLKQLGFNGCPRRKRGGIDIVKSKNMNKVY